jgi:23S rRNA (adenine2503-C2)-methyltransferase
MGINATVRRTLGSDIEAACGQLRREASKQTEKSGEVN